MRANQIPPVPERINMKQHIANTTEYLLDAMPLESITVKMILEAAKTSKTTFYRYYKDINDVVLWIYISHVDKAAETTKNFEELALAAFRVMYEKSKYMQRALSYSQQNSLSEYIFRRSLSDVTEIVKKSLNVETVPPDLLNSILFFCAGCREVWSNWAMLGMKQSPETLVHCIMCNVPLPLQPFLYEQES